MKSPTFTLILVCVITFILQLVPGFTDLFILDSSKPLEIWRIVSSIFLHGDILHLMYNMFALFFFGIILEKYIGNRNFLIVFFTSGIIANLISVPFYNLSLGASGAIFGVIGALIIIRPTLSVFAFGLPMPIFIAGILWVAGDLLGAVSFLSGNPINNTGNIAHLSGIFIGLILGLFFKRSQPKQIKYSIQLDEDQIRRWEDINLR